jgi:hypothetical protein
MDKGQRMARKPNGDTEGSMDELQAPGSVFRKSFLRICRDLDETSSSCEAMLSGQWRIVEREDGLFDVYREWDDQSTEPPFATFKRPDHALLLVAVAPHTIRPPVYEVIQEGSKHLLFCVGQEVGTFQWEPDEIVDILNVAAQLVRNPSALAYCLQAAGPSVIEVVGRLLYERMGRHDRE